MGRRPSNSNHRDRVSAAPRIADFAGTAAAAIAIFALCLPRIAASLTPEAEAENAARAWLGMLDAGNYAQSWNTASARFRASITQAEWVSRVSAVRGPLGAVRSRELSSARVAHSLPGAPDGEYVVLEFSTSYEHKTVATETVTPMKDPDGKWHVSGYYIK